MRAVRRFLGKALAGAWDWIKQPKNFLASLLFGVGVPGFLDDIGAWLKWFDEWVALFPEGSVDKVADFLASEWSRWGALGLALFIFEIDKVRLGILWFRSRAEYAVAVVSGERHFVSDDEALQIVARSDWARSRKTSSEPGSLSISSALRVAFSSLDADSAEKEKKYLRWCSLVLDKFQEARADSVQIVDDEDQYDEAELRDWLDGRYDSDVIDEFGNP